MFLCAAAAADSTDRLHQTPPDSLLSLFGVSPQTQRLLLWPGLRPASL